MGASVSHKHILFCSIVICECIVGLPGLDGQPCLRGMFADAGGIYVSQTHLVLLYSNL